MAYLEATKRGKGRFVWVDRWTRWVAIQTGTIGLPATPMLIELDDDDAATERVEREIARAKHTGFAPTKLPAKPKRAIDGDTLVFFGLGKPLPAPRRLTWPRELSDALRADPDDELTWALLRAWLEDNVPAMRSLQDATSINLSKLTPEQERLMFCDPKGLVPPVITSATWRHGHIIECTLSTRNSMSAAAALTACGDAPAFAFVRSLDIAVLGAGMLNNLSSLAPRLRTLKLRIDGKGDVPVGWFERCRRLETLELNTKWPAEIWAHTFPTVTDLMVDMRHLGSNATALAQTLDAIDESAPKLVTLRPFVLAGWKREGQCSVLLDVLARSKLLSRVARVIFESSEERDEVDAERRRTWRGGSFAHLEQLELAAINLRLMA